MLRKLWNSEQFEPRIQTIFILTSYYYYLYHVHFLMSIVLPYGHIRLLKITAMLITSVNLNNI